MRRLIRMQATRFTNMKIDGHASRLTREIALWLAIASILLAGVCFSWNPTPFAHALAAIFIACAFVHALFLYGPRAAMAFFITSIAITFAMENIGVATGFPFG